MESGSQKVDCCRKRKPERTNSTTPQASRAGFWEEAATTLTLISRIKRGKGIYSRGSVRTKGLEHWSLHGL